MNFPQRFRCVDDNGNWERIPPRVPIPTAELPTDLDSAVNALLVKQHPDIPRPTRWSPAVVGCARGYLDAWQDELAPPDRGRLVQWLLPINASVRNIFPQDDFERRVGALEIASTQLPSFVFNPATQRQGLNTWIYMPAVSEITALVSDAHRTDLDRLAAIKRIAGSNPSAV